MGGSMTRIPPPIEPHAGNVLTVDAITRLMINLILSMMDLLIARTPATHTQFLDDSSCALIIAGQKCRYCN